MDKGKALSTMPYDLTSISSFATEESWINTRCKYIISLCFMLQYYACHCNKKSTRFVKEIINWNPPLPLETSTISCIVKFCGNFPPPKWSHSTRLNTAPFRTQAVKPASRSHFTTDCQLFSQSISHSFLVVSLFWGSLPKLSWSVECCWL